MDDLWFEDELEPSPDTIESATGEIKGPTAEGLVAVAATNNTSWQTQMANAGKRSDDFWKIPCAVACALALRV